MNEKSFFFEIWTSKKAIKIRKKLNESDRNFSPCNICDVKGDLIGKKTRRKLVKKIYPNENKRSSRKSH